ncbi:MAG: (4Fe-4S)-binding protein [Chitinophagaceae bacterium]|nr:(4Fe-4S)-binding protein [Chitinophagaceae bacterium]
MDRKITKKYTNGEVTIVWKPDACRHSARCFTGLPEVFDPGIRPWINPQGSTTEKIIAQVSKCPTGALSFFMNQQEETSTEQ